MSEQAKQTPLVELLTAVPEDVRIGVQDGEDWHAGTTWHSVGRLCRDAAAELRRLHEAHEWQYKMAGDRLRRIEKLETVNQELRKALREAALALAHAAETVPVVYDDDYNRVSAAIAKAEGQA